MGRRGTPPSADTLHWLRLLRRRGLSIRRVARECGVSRNTARKYLRQGAAGWKFDPPRKYA
jgi:transposase